LKYRNVRSLARSLFHEIKKDKEIFEKFYEKTLERGLRIEKLKRKVKELEEKLREEKEKM